MTENLITETFEGTPIPITQVGDARWVRGQDITRALGFADPVKAMEKILTRNRAEFDASTTCMVEMQTASGWRTVRLYNARGAALIAMKAKTPKGEAFRRWVLGVLEGREGELPVALATDIPDGVRSTLAHWFMQRRGNPQLLRYRAMGLGPAEIARLLKVTPASVNPRLRVAEFLGLAEQSETTRALRQKPNFLKLVEGRERKKQERLAALQLSAPAGEPTDGQ